MPSSRIANSSELFCPREPCGYYSKLLTAESAELIGGVRKENTPAATFYFLSK